MDKKQVAVAFYDFLNTAADLPLWTKPGGRDYYEDALRSVAPLPATERHLTDLRSVLAAEGWQVQVVDSIFLSERTATVDSETSGITMTAGSGYVERDTILLRTAPPAALLHTTIHEAFHARYHTRNTDLVLDTWPDRHERAIADFYSQIFMGAWELQAESAAFLTMQGLGYEPCSASAYYVRQWTQAIPTPLPPVISIPFVEAMHAAPHHAVEFVPEFVCSMVADLGGTVNES